MNLFCVGLSHHTSNVETRERFAGHAESECILRTAGCAEALLLTTCNRVEVYGASEKRVSTDEIAQCLAREIETGRATNMHLHFTATKAKSACSIFSESPRGLDSMVVGESEIFGQTKKAYESRKKI